MGSLCRPLSLHLGLGLSHCRSANWPSGGRAGWSRCEGKLEPVSVSSDLQRQCCWGELPQGLAPFTMELHTHLAQDLERWKWGVFWSGAPAVPGAALVKRWATTVTMVHSAPTFRAYSKHIAAAASLPPSELHARCLLLPTPPQHHPGKGISGAVIPV